MTYPGKRDNLQGMERIPVIAGRFLIKLSPEELQDLRENTDRAIELGVHASEILHKNETQTEPVSNVEREIGGIVHAVINENLSVEETEARIKLIAELNTSDHPTEDK